MKPTALKARAVRPARRRDSRFCAATSWSRRWLWARMSSIVRAASRGLFVPRHPRQPHPDGFLHGGIVASPLQDRLVARAHRSRTATARSTGWPGSTEVHRIDALDLAGGRRGYTFEGGYSSAGGAYLRGHR